MRSQEIDVLVRRDYIDIVVSANPSGFPYPKRRILWLLDLRLSRRARAIVDRQLREFTHIYLVKDADTGLIKIGKSDDPNRRLTELLRQSTLLPREHQFSLVRSWEDYEYMEAGLHSRFADKRVRGEWFDLNDEDLRVIEAQEAFARR